MLLTSTFQNSSLKNLEIDHSAVLWLHKLALKQQGEIVLQLVLYRGGPSCCNMNLGLWEQLWPGWGENIERLPPCLHLWEECLQPKGSRTNNHYSSIDTCQVLIYHHLWLSRGKINKQPRLLLCKLQEFYFFSHFVFWVCVRNSRMGFNTVEILLVEEAQSYKGNMKHTLVSPPPSPL